MAVETGQFTHSLEQIDDAVTDVTNAKGQSASLSDAITAAAESAATTAVGALDVSEVGGTGKYISAIKEENGIIVPTAANLASAPASGGTAAISSGAVYTALSGKIGIADAFGLGNNTEIPNDANLNGYTTAGIFIRSSAPNPSTMLNTPFGGDYQAKAFKLIVEPRAFVLVLTEKERFIPDLTSVTRE